MSDESLAQDATDLPDGTLTVASVVNALSRAVANAFDTPVWVAGTIGDAQDGVRPGRNGWLSFKLYDAAPGRDSAAVASASKLPVSVLPSNAQSFITACSKARIGLRDGVPVRVRGKLVHYPRSGQVVFQADKIDAEFTVGRLVVDRELLIAELERAGVFAKQRRMTIPFMPLKLALVCAANSAARHDVEQHLRSSGYGFEVVVYDTVVQGENAPAQIKTVLARADRGFSIWQPDAILVVRGGGARTDLAAFDDEAVVRAIASCNHPVVVGVGHEVDTTVSDKAGCKAAKTPTAAAQIVIDQVAAAVARTERLAERTERAASNRLERADRSAERVFNKAVALVSALYAAAENAVVGRDVRAAQVAEAALAKIDDQLVRVQETSLKSSLSSLDREDAALRNAASVVAAFDPARVLARGYTITKTEAGDYVRDPASVLPGTKLRTITSNGEILSTVEPAASENAPRAAERTVAAHE